MKEMLYLFNSTHIVGKIFYERETDTWSFERLNYEPITEPAMKRFLLDYNSNCIKISFEERTFPPNRMNASELLSLIGLKHYDLWEIMKRTHGVTAFDAFWLNETPDTTWFVERYTRLKAPEKIF